MWIASHAYFNQVSKKLCYSWQDRWSHSVEVPCDPADAELVKKHMMHKHPPLMQDLNSYCQRMVGGRRICHFGYPKPLQQNTVIDGAGRIHYQWRKEGDEWVVPHCLPLLRKFHCHLNFEASSTSDLFQYIFKYIHKGDEDWPVEKRVLLIKHWWWMFCAFRPGSRWHLCSWRGSARRRNCRVLGCEVFIRRRSRVVNTGLSHDDQITQCDLTADPIT